MNPIRFHRELAQRGYDVIVVDDFATKDKDLYCISIKCDVTEALGETLKELGATGFLPLKGGITVVFDKKGC